MKIKDYFLLLVPSDSNRSVKLHISRKTIVLFLLILALLVSFFAYTFYLYFTIHKDVAKVKELQLKNIRVSKQLVAYQSRIKKIEERLDKIKTMSMKLSIISHLADTDRHPAGVVNSLNGMLDDFEEVYSASFDEVEEKLRTIKQKLGKLEYDSVLQEEKISALSDYLAAQSALLASTPAILPTHGWFTSPFGHRIDPFTGKVKRHDGVDIAARVGTPVVAPADGIVVFAGRKGGYGLMLVIDHGYGITTRYGHLNRVLVSHGSTVYRGMPIAAVGNTGRSTGPHLHYEVRLNGVAVNPMKFILDASWEH